MSINDQFYEMTGRELKDYEEFFNYQNEYNEWCYVILDRYTGEEIERNAY